MTEKDCDVVIIGAGIVGIACAYYLKQMDSSSKILLLDSGLPMEMTSAHSGENYRNWWPHPTMSQFTDRSIELMEAISTATDDRINLTRRGYVLATRKEDSKQLLSELYQGYAKSPEGTIRIHDSETATSYHNASLTKKWQDSPVGVDVITNESLIKRLFPSYDKSLKTVVHVRRAGSVDSQQMGQFMLERFKAAGGELLPAHVESISLSENGFEVTSQDKSFRIKTTKLVNAAGPYVNEIAHLLNIDLPVTHTLQQKIAFEDTAKAIPRALPFTIDLDEQLIDWSADERAAIADDSTYGRYTELMPGSIHCRPDGGDRGNWVKLGWAFNNASSTPVPEPVLNDFFPEIVVRGAARLNPALKLYCDSLPRRRRHYGGYYSMTAENWPLIGPMGVEGSFIAGAMSGFGTMAACAAGELCAQWVLDKERPEFAADLSLERYENAQLMTQLHALSSRGVL